jgi:tetratricopeptide (TPR) repeat protein
MIKLTCPSCNAALELPDDLGVAHCVYCGTRIVLEAGPVAREQEKLERAVELCKVALQAKNYEDTIRYSNMILEIDPRNVQAWIEKAIATFWLTTGGHNRYDEAVGYLRRAAEISPEDPRVAAAYAEVTQLQARWYNRLGNDSFEHAERTYAIYAKTGYVDMADLVAHSLAGPVEARQHSHEHYVQAMEHYLRASSFAPSDTVILENIAGTANRAKWVEWSETVTDKITLLRRLQVKAQAEAQRQALARQLVAATQDLEKAKNDKGLLAGRRLATATDKVKKLKEQLAKCEAAAAYQPPEPPPMS